MKPYEQNLNAMLSIWNTTDENEQKKLASQAFEHNLHFADPNHNIMGIPAFLKMVKQVQSQIPGTVYSRASRVDMQNNHCRYHWAIHMGDQQLMAGFDCTEVNDAGKIVKVIGFFGELALD